MSAVVRVGVGVLIRDPLHPGKVSSPCECDNMITVAITHTLTFHHYINPQIFAGLRRNSHGSGTLALPGGHLEMYESWVECAIRETLEETGLHIGNLRFGHVTNDIMKEIGKHYVTIFMMGEVITVEDAENDHGDGAGVNVVRSAQLRPMNLEPHKCDGWDSYSWEELRRFASFSSKSATDHPDHTMENGASEGEGEAGRIILFGPLLKLLEEAPSNVVDFITNTPNQHDL